ESQGDVIAGARGARRGAVATELRSRQIELRVVEPDSDTREEIDDLRALSEAINASMSFPNASFDYSLGPVSGLVDRYGVDALVFVWGRARLPTGGHKVLSALSGSGGTDVGQMA